jgi:hypothetical protein
MIQADQLVKTMRLTGDKFVPDCLPNVLSSTTVAFPPRSMCLSTPHGHMAADNTKKRVWRIIVVGENAELRD